MSYFLYEHPNPNAWLRANGIRFHGYPERREPIRHIVIHTAENTPDFIGLDGGAEAVARYQARVERPSSYHEIGDSDSYVTMLPDEAVAFGAKGANSDGWHFSFATQAHLWLGKPQWWVDQALAIAARRCALRAAAHDIPVQRLTQAEYRANQQGFVAHADVDPDRRSDPGPRFPWDRFLGLVADYMQEDDMAQHTAELASIALNTKAAVEEARATNRLQHALVADAVRTLRAEFGMDADPESDELWAGWISDGERTFEDCHQRFRDETS